MGEVPILELIGEFFLYIFSSYNLYTLKYKLSEQNISVDFAKSLLNQAFMRYIPIIFIRVFLSIL